MLQIYVKFNPYAVFQVVVIGVRDKSMKIAINLMVFWLLFALNIE